MKKYIYLVISILVAVYIYGYHITKSEKVLHSYKNGILVQNKQISNSKVNLSINGIIEKNLIFGKGIKLFKTLEGTLKIDQKTYNLNLGITEDNVYFGNAFEDKNDIKVFTIFLSNDFKSIYLINDKEKYEIISANTIEEFNHTKELFLK